jgi:hypothetical protein
VHFLGTLDLSDNALCGVDKDDVGRWGTDCMRHLMSALRSNTSVRTLDLSDNQLSSGGDEPMRMLVETLQ